MAKNSKDRTPLQLSAGIVTVPIRYEITETIMEQLRKDLLAFVAEQNAHSVVFDMKGLEILDAHDFLEMTSLIQTLKIMGQQVMVCGLSPGVTAAIIEQDLDARDWNTCFDLNEAITKLAKKK